MAFLSQNRPVHPAVASLVRAQLPNAYDLVALALILLLGIALLHGAEGARAPLSALPVEAVSLDPTHLPEYGLRTTLRMFAAMTASLLFTFVVATLAAKSQRAERLIVPALDVLQSVPVLGFLTFTVTFFLGLFPGSQLGAECASVFALFTSQAWNMAFSFYQSLRTVPRDLQEVSRGFGFSAWLRFWRLEVPFAMPGLIWNMMMSMSGGWFFVVASEAITVGDTTVTLPGIGSYLALAIANQQFGAVAWAVAAMALLILLYDQLLFRPIVVWADKFRVEMTAGRQIPRSWVYDLICRTRLLKRLVAPLTRLWQRVLILRWTKRNRVTVLPVSPRVGSVRGDRLWRVVLFAVAAACIYFVFNSLWQTLDVEDLTAALGGALATLLRVVVLIALASLIWVPIGVWIGLRPVLAQRVQPLVQFLAAFPANVLFPFAVVAIVSAGANPNIWLSPLMVLGTQWYILFNVIAGASAFPTDLKEAAQVYRLRSWTWWRRVMLPGIFPYYLTGALTASGGSWNASIVAELVSWGHQHLQAYGLGSYIASATEAGDYPRVLLGVVVMSLFVTVFNRTLWRRLFVFAERRLRLD
ncbi:ABC transporter permease [Xylella fastidiosa]|uniref:ABC transporter permease n=1 Tax=Xylella fastidiosa TaxID=2371 RepID=UPI000FE3B7D4|nr:ABC transporter permease subunit [Xylella fastidiosa]MRT35274.1 ABC transporter permease subunit [Xylella fastidiosa subsp. multiplex]MRT46924.1 ABC transporter permease subunit [Xylella fastidiosa subsp. multiplex]MRT97131.1 ABC transporter permease subunit [Xylella fastidiosa subsp. multiplex]MRU29672.1 ABC transporter permease subunit [Xylella fastidiosa subsp. multiplex]MRU31868.1 ABC transporter permease subunit [Xylella fastidiosa subsp. multiplex]